MIRRALAFCFSVIILHAQLVAQTADSAPAPASKPAAEAKPAATKPVSKPPKPAAAPAAAPAKKSAKPAAPAAKPEPAPEKKGFRFPWSKKNKEAAVPATPPPGTLPTEPKKPKAPVDNFKTYMTKVKGALGKRWADAVQPRMDEFTPGNVNCSFMLDSEGKVASFTVAANSSNEAFAKFCEDFVKETPFEAPPPKLLVEGQLEIPFTFWIY